MSKQPEPVAINFDREVALALFEWAQRFTETRNPQFTHPADALALAYIASELEWLLPEVFTDAYPELLKSSRKKVVAKYVQDTGLDWVAGLSYQDTDPGAGT